jgi:hypothetical protein
MGIGSSSFSGVDMPTSSQPTAERWQDLLSAIDFVESRLRFWQEAGRMPLRQLQSLLSFYAAHKQNWQESAKAGERFPEGLGLAPPPHGKETAAQIEWRHWLFLRHELKEHQASGRMTLNQVHGFDADTKGRMAKLQQQMAEEIPLALPVEEEPRKPGRNILEILLDPRSIQWLLGFGGGLMILGLIILLWVNKYFTPPVVAISMGIANLAVLVGGWGIIRYSRYQVAGRALTLLACLVMPLNLWYYHTHGLMTIDGHLWAAALVISVLYAASALVLRDELFVYVFVGGIALTGLLILADWPPSPQKFWEIASPSTLLVVLGLISLHAERAFPNQEGPFSRRRFGLAFFWSGHALLAAGLLLVLGAQVAGKWLYEPIFKHYYLSWKAEPSPIITEQWGQILALCLVIAAVYAYLYSDIVVRRIGVYLYLAAGMLMWAEVLAIDLLQIRLGMDFLIAILAGTGLLVNVLYGFTSRQGPMARPLPVLGLLLGLAPVALGLIAFIRALNPDLKSIWQAEPPSWPYVGAMALAAISCRYGAFVSSRRQPSLALAYFCGAGAATMVAVLATLAALGLNEWHQHAPLLMLLPLAYLLAARFYKGKPEERPLLVVADAATVAMLISSLASAFEGFAPVRHPGYLNLTLSLFFAEAAVYYGLSAGLRKIPVAIHACAAMACAAVWQLLTYLGVHSETYTLTFAVVGLLLLVAYRFAIVERYAASGMAVAAFQSANVLLSLSFVAALFMGLSRLATRQVHWSFVGLCLTLTLISLLAVALVREPAWRRWYLVTTVLQVLLTILAIQVLSQLSIPRKLEIFAVASGLALLAIGHVGWYRERDHEEDLVSFSLVLGSVLAGLPLLIATCIDRWSDQPRIPDEIGFFCIGVLLLVTGFLFKLRSTTLAGAVYTIAYFALLLLFVPWKQINAVALTITVGGGAIFATGLLLSLYRDRLMSLPDRIKRREGIYRVLSWR